jgi:hypothetical protein
VALASNGLAPTAPAQTFDIYILYQWLIETVKQNFKLTQPNPHFLN